MVLAVVVQIGQVVITAVAAYSRFSVSGNDRKYERATNRFWVFQLLSGPALRYSARRCCVADPARHLSRFPEIVRTDREHTTLNKNCNCPWQTQRTNLSWQLLSLRRLHWHVNKGFTTRARNNREAKVILLKAILANDWQDKHNLYSLPRANVYGGALKDLSGFGQNFVKILSSHDKPSAL